VESTTRESLGDMFEPDEEPPHENPDEFRKGYDSQMLDPLKRCVLKPKPNKNKVSTYLEIYLVLPRFRFSNRQ